MNEATRVIFECADNDDATKIVECISNAIAMNHLSMDAQVNLRIELFTAINIDGESPENDHDDDD